MSFIHPKGLLNRNRIINAIMALDNAYPWEITDFIEKDIWKRKNNNYEFAAYSEEEKKALVRKEMIKERTLFNWLRILTKEGTIEHSNNKYSLAEKAKLDNRNFPELVGESLLTQLMLLHRPTVYSFEHNIKQLVESFGFYVLYCFIHAARRMENEYLSAESRDKLATNWISKSISPASMYEYFLVALENQEYDEEKIKREHAKYRRLFLKWKKNLISDNEASPPSTDYFYFEKFKPKLNANTVKKASKSRYEVSDTILEKILSILQNQYRPYYDELSINRFMPLGFSPKEQLIRD